MGNAKHSTKTKTTEKSSFLGLRSLEEEIKFLKANLHAPASEKDKAKKGFSSLEGLWKGKTSLSYEDIKSAEIKLKDF